ARSLLSDTSIRLGFTCTRSWLMPYITLLIRSWMECGCSPRQAQAQSSQDDFEDMNPRENVRIGEPLAKFPFSLLGFDSLDAFVRQTDTMIVPVAAILSRMPALDLVAKVVGCDRNALYSIYFGQIYAFYLPHCALEND